jgi:hypothetical protein
MLWKPFLNCAYVKTASMAINVLVPWRRGLVVSSPPCEEMGAMGREIESHRGIGRVVALKEKKLCAYATLFTVGTKNSFKNCLFRGYVEYIKHPTSLPTALKINGTRSVFLCR